MPVDRLCVLRSAVPDGGHVATSLVCCRNASRTAILSASHQRSAAGSGKAAEGRLDGARLSAAVRCAAPVLRFREVWGSSTVPPPRTRSLRPLQARTHRDHRSRRQETRAQPECRHPPVSFHRSQHGCERSRPHARRRHQLKIDHGKKVGLRGELAMPSPRQSRTPRTTVGGASLPLGPGATRCPVQSCCRNGWQRHDFHVLKRQ
jgi:hypothetical protein